MVYLIMQYIQYTLKYNLYIISISKTQIASLMRCVKQQYLLLYMYIGEVYGIWFIN